MAGRGPSRPGRQLGAAPHPWVCEEASGSTPMATPTHTHPCPPPVRFLPSPACAARAGEYLYFGRLLSVSSFSPPPRPGRQRERGELRSFGMVWAGLGWRRARPGTVLDRVVEWPRLRSIPFRLAALYRPSRPTQRRPSGERTRPRPGKAGTP